ncbi:TetR/AcrR family transcriptional regulator [Amycolatopsis cynarae]|uniref:TetR/AcrR family transcriptional regulator n=1 Tax=Amycolatopsis cynarae TaxID=2995223 RepID=A0ABY7B4F2_9PSEU|nr:TetR/AcrR family transcriptional regulator [Amycolatopsis sp. HUAS 11-8]WAL65776.1 TetR/AcrR family transcriptional regulator [Amycolatopsis sp. HUAS 11-8]
MSTPGKRGRGRPRKLPLDEQRALVLVAARHVFATHGVQGATIEQVARCAGVTRQAVYDLFDDKTVLFERTVADVEELVYRHIAELGEDGPDLDLPTWARAGFSALVTLAAEYPDALVVLKQAERAGNPALNRLRTRLAEIYTAASRRRWNEHGIESGRADRALVAMCFAMTEALVDLAWEGDPPEPEAIIDLLTEFTIGGVQRLRQAPEILARVR